MKDVYLSDAGDIMLSHNGDIAMVDDRQRHYAQQAYIRMMTERGDFELYPTLGASLDELVGMPNTPQTAEYGKNLILNAMNREGIFAGVPIDIKAIPVSLQSIRFDLYLNIGSRIEKMLSIEQNLNALAIETGHLLGDQDEEILGG